MIRLYNDTFIEQFSEKDYIKALKNVNHLDTLRNNYHQRYNPDYGVFNGTLYLFKESLDHYVLKKMKHEASFINTIECHNYFNYLKKMQQQSSFDFYTNIVSHQVINNSRFANYKEKFGFNNSESLSKNYNSMIQIKSIIYKIDHHQELTQNELDLICGFVHDYRENTSTIKKVIYYIFNNLTKPDSKLKSSPQVAAAILTYIPYVSSAIKQNGFTPENIRLVAANRYHRDEEYTRIGQSSSSKKHIIINGQIAKDIQFKNIPLLTNASFFIKHSQNKEYPFSIIILTAFHEITHQYQTYLSKSLNDEPSSITSFMEYGYPNIVTQVLNSELHDYHHNHDNDYIEIQATQIGWQMSYDFYKEILDNSFLKTSLLKSSLKNKRTTAVHHTFALKKDQTKKLHNRLIYDYISMLKIMKDETKRLKYFKKYPGLKTIFSENGKYRSDIIFYSNFASTNAGVGIIINLLNSPKVDQLIIKKLSNNPNAKQMIINAITNIYQAIVYNEKRLALIEYYSRHEFDDSGYTDKILLPVANSVVADYTKTLANGQRILNQVLNCHQYDSQITSSQIRATSRYQEIVENINNKNNQKIKK